MFCRFRPESLQPIYPKSHHALTGDEQHRETPRFMHPISPTTRDVACAMMVQPKAANSVAKTPNSTLRRAGHILFEVIK
jgi:hypothetical protein